MLSASQEFFQSSILKKGRSVCSLKKVRFDTIVKAARHRVNGRRLSEMDASMVTKSWLSSKASKMKRRLEEDPVHSQPMTRCDTSPPRAAVEEEYEVESILDHKKSGKGEFIYLLKWKGYSEAENSWEPATNLNCQDILDDYHRKHNLTPYELPEDIPPMHKIMCKSKHGPEHRTNLVHESINNFLLENQVASKRKKKKRHHEDLASPDEWYVQKTSSSGVKIAKKKKNKVKPLIVRISLESGLISTGQPPPGGALECSLAKMQDEICVDEVCPLPSVSSSTTCEKSFKLPLPQSDLCDQSSKDTTNQQQHYLSCVYHDHDYLKNNFAQKNSPLETPSFLTPPPSAEPCTKDTNDLPPNSPELTDVCSIVISPPQSPSFQPSPSCTTDPQSSSEHHRLNNEMDSDSCSQLDSSTLSPAIFSSLPNREYTWSSTSSVSSDIEVLSGDNTRGTTKVSTPTTKPRNGPDDLSETLHSVLNRGSKKKSRTLHMSLNRSHSKNGIRWRKGPIPLPRSFSGWHSGSSLLKTSAAKLCISGISATNNKTNEVRHSSLSPLQPSQGFQRVKNKKIKKALISSNENHHHNHHQATQPTTSTTASSPSPKVPEVESQEDIDKSLEYASMCAYKEQLMNWQYELNKQRDGTDDLIYVENDVDKVPPPTDFNYVSSNVYTEGVPNPSDPELSSSLCGCECYYLGRKCGPKSEYCCANMAGSRFAYTPHGKVKVPPGTPIYECNAKCSCPSDCSNRIVQLGRKLPLCIFRTKDTGWGVKTTQPIKPNTFVTEYVGEVITNEEAERRGKKCDAQGITYLFDLDFEDENSAFTIDAARFGNISHFFNHSCDPNLVVYSVWIDTLDKRLPRLAFFTTRSISVGEELTFDYQMNSNDHIGTSGPRMPCLCGAKNCLGYIN